jgi:hypothetical protein
MVMVVSVAGCEEVRDGEGRDGSERSFIFNFRFVLKSLKFISRPS